MVAKWPRRRVAPRIGAISLDLGIQRISPPVFRLSLLSNDDKPHLLISVVQEGVADTCASWKCDAVTRLQRVQYSVDPSVWMTLHHKDELFFSAFGVGIRGTSAGQQPNVMYANACQTE